jgi:hypothetical protein
MIVYAGENIKQYLAWGKATIAGMVLLCPVCGRRLIGDGWRDRVAKQESQPRTSEEKAPTIRVHELFCPDCKEQGRSPHYFRALPSFLFPFNHFCQSVRLKVFDRAWLKHESALAIEAVLSVDRWLVRVWLARALDVLAAALPALGAALEECRGQWPADEPGAGLWVRWWALGLALRAAMEQWDPALGRTPGSVLEWVAVLGARRQRWWAP